MAYISKISCIIVTYNAEKWVDKCFDCLAKSTEKVEIVVVDNNSTDNTINHIKQICPTAHIIANKVNKGFGQANNQGIEYAYKNGCEHFFLLNQDAYVRTDTVEKLVRAQKENGYEIVSPIHLNGDGSKIDHGFMAYVKIDNVCDDIISDSLLHTPRANYNVSYVNAACWMISRNAIETIGGFDPLFFHYGEDRNYCQRLNYHNGILAVIPDCFVHHDRLFYGHAEVYNSRKVISSLLVEHANVNKGLFSIDMERIKKHVALWRDLLVSVVTLRFKNAYNIMKGFFVMYSSVLKISHSISINQKKAFNWLNI